MDNVEMRVAGCTTNDQFMAVQEALLECASNSMVEQLILRVNKLDEIFLTRFDYDIYIEKVIKETDEKLA